VDLQGVVPLEVEERLGEGGAGRVAFAAGGDVGEGGAAKVVIAGEQFVEELEHLSGEEGGVRDAVGEDEGEGAGEGIVTQHGGEEETAQHGLALGITRGLFADRRPQDFAGVEGEVLLRFVGGGGGEGEGGRGGGVYMGVWVGCHGEGVGRDLVPKGLRVGFIVVNVIGATMGPTVTTSTVTTATTNSMTTATRANFPRSVSKCGRRVAEVARRGGKGGQRTVAKVRGRRRRFGAEKAGLIQRGRGGREKRVPTSRHTYGGRGKGGGGQLGGVVERGAGGAAMGIRRNTLGGAGGKRRGRR